MPELPEVETVRRELALRLEGCRVRDVRIRKADIVLGPTPAARFARELHGRRIREVCRRGKLLLWRLDDGSVVQVQLRMTGRFAIGPPRPPRVDFRHVAAVFRFEDGTILYYDDTRRLGGFRRWSARDWAAVESRLGPEPLAPGFRAVDLRRRLTSRGPVKNALLDQKRLAGVGNIYASEALHRARIDPRRPGSSLDADEARRLHAAIRRVFREALAAAGTTLRDYRALNGRSGSFQRRLRVYGRAGEPCKRCGADVRRLVQAGRSTYWCPGCQA
ncbi:MAG: bifunctional DNA-formamidopyrimidine glycosylase/DNA-(apurinic or apyrimidinic site) lyase [Gemmatimonadota bacterium]